MRILEGKQILDFRRVFRFEKTRHLLYFFSSIDVQMLLTEKSEMFNGMRIEQLKFNEEIRKADKQTISFNKLLFVI